MRLASAWRTALAVISLLALGAATGITADHIVRRHHAVAIPMAELHKDPLALIDREVKLRPEQRARIAAILRSHQAEIDSVWHDTHVYLQSRVAALVTEISATLDPDQAARFQELAHRIHGHR